MHIPLKTWIVVHVCYREIFKAPVLVKDLKKWLKSNDFSQIDLCISYLINEGILYLEDGYVVRKGNEQFIRDQPEKSELTKELLNSVKRVSKFLSFIPFIKFVGVSGSIAAENPTVDKVGFNKGNIDVDFYVIAAKNTLWVFLFFERVFNNLYHLILRKHTYCFNYCTEEDFLEVVNKSFYTSTELNNLLKLYGTMDKNEVLLQNLWATNYYNLDINTRELSYKKKRRILRQSLYLLNKTLYYIYFMMRSIKNFKLDILSFRQVEFNNAYRYNLKRISNPNGGYEMQVSRRFADLMSRFYPDYYDSNLIAFLFPNDGMAEKVDPENEREVYEGYITKYAD